ncbi:uncharacterized protein NECHADRAFT_80107 [Fusarium vanettenii 77-13-4]|uniref:Uncharacterized protein n=1 Tax=Fusarium vanettenii (strain ATCC MYA-4622 / CBS 123669 / FGSC 9596 / NRRL 45880 / 77-13-4) TaxID=660122 RepID=C7Z142_FUSV7|nr:uncharacterized protein NECHADRAFT_80107 [Fusarium vanettenii 77-13-4]EEU42299.1 predicted protein [Fusarium vanettenii 77-13-4]
MAPAKKHMSFDWYESTTNEYIQPVEVAEKPVVKAEEEKEEKVTIYITGKPTNKRFCRSWAITLYDGSTKEFRSYEVRKPFRHTPCTLKSSTGHPGETDVQYITIGKVSCERAQELLDLCETVPIKESNNATYSNRQYINDMARFLVAGDFVSKSQRRKALGHFTNFINAERQQIEAEHQKDEREVRTQERKAKTQGQKSESGRQSQKKATKAVSQGNGFPAWFLDTGN